MPSRNMGKVVREQGPPRMARLGRLDAGTAEGHEMVGNAMVMEGPGACGGQ